MSQAARFVVAGLVLGLALALGVTRLVSTMLFGVAATDVLTFAQVAAVVVVVSLLACAVPTARANRLAAAVPKAE
jgi:putative ABC transport system permease protein